MPFCEFGVGSIDLTDSTSKDHLVRYRRIWTNTSALFYFFIPELLFESAKF